MKKNVKQFLVDRYTEEWIKENKEFVEDYQELCEDLLLFRANWGIEIGFIFKNSEEIKGREIGAGPEKEIDEFFNAQKKTIKKRNIKFKRIWKK